MVPCPERQERDRAFFEAHGFLVLEGAIDAVEIDEVGERCEEIIAHKHELAFDWA